MGGVFFSRLVIVVFSLIEMGVDGRKKRPPETINRIKRFSQKINLLLVCRTSDCACATGDVTLGMGTGLVEHAGIVPTMEIDIGLEKKMSRKETSCITEHRFDR